MKELSQQAQANLKRLATDFEFRVKNTLKIRPKDGSIADFELNQAQKYINSKLDEQKEKKGYVRAIVLKARQQGCSTLIAARFFDRVVSNPGIKAFILAHREDATTNLYSLVDRFYENYPPVLRPSIKESNAKRLFFDNGSGYGVGTSGGGNVGRSDTIQLLHMSEAAFYENTDELKSGIMQTVPDLPGTEIIIESTANGLGNMFHKMSMLALDGGYDYQLIFVPWFWQEEYRLDASDIVLEPEEKEYQRLWDLSKEQMTWRRNKTKTIGEWKFKQEYPCCVQEAFEASDDDKLIRSKFINEARKAIITPAPNLIVGVDPAGPGKDQTAIVWRRGRVMTGYRLLQRKDLMEVIGSIVEIINTEKPQHVFIDVGGMGQGVYDRLMELGYRDVTAVNFASKAERSEIFVNKRAEIWSRMRDWISDIAGAQIPNDDQLQIELSCARELLDSGGRFKVEPKEDIRKRLGKSPDIADALALTFSHLLPAYNDMSEIEEYWETRNSQKHSERNRISGY